MTEQTSTTLHGTVEKIITSSDPSEPEKAQIAIENADKTVSRNPHRDHFDLNSLNVLRFDGSWPPTALHDGHWKS